MLRNAVLTPFNNPLREPAPRGSYSGLDLDFVNRRFRVGGRLVPFERIISLSAPSPKYIWNSQGQFVEEQAGQPAWDHDPVTGEALGQRIEPSQATNQAKRSEDLGPAFWVAAGASSVQLNQLIAPNGAQTMDKVTIGPSTADIFYQPTNAFPSSVRVEPSFFCDPIAETERLQLNITGGGANDQRGSWDIDLALVTPGDRITRDHPAVTVTQEFVTSSDIPGRAGMLFRSPDNTPLTIGIWGCQIELGEKSSSYIPTFDNAVARSADVAAIANVDTAEWFGTGAGTIFIEYEQGELKDRISLIGTGGTGNFDWGVQEGNGTDSYELWNGVTPGQRVFVDYSALGGRPTGRVKLAFSWNGQQNILAVNGVISVVSAGFTPAATPEYALIRLFHADTVNRAMNTVVQNLRAFKYAKTGSELQELTS